MDPRAQPFLSAIAQTEELLRRAAAANGGEEGPK